MRGSGHVFENIYNERLKSLCSVSESESHVWELKKPKVCDDGGFWGLVRMKWQY
jgi:hypothetical protein